MVVNEGADDDMAIDMMDESWHWGRSPLGVLGPFGSVEEAEEWMAQKEALEEAD